jgi:hypothetical protein
MKLKYLVAALGLVAAAGAQAQLIVGSTNGGSSLLLTVWEQNAPSGAPDQSFTLNLNTNLANFIAGDANSQILATLSSSDPTWQNFLATSDTTDVGALQWSVAATGTKTAQNPSTGAWITGSYGSLASVQNGQEAAAASQTNSTIAASNTAYIAYIQALNASGAANVNEQVNGKGTNAYFMQQGQNNLQSASWLNNNNIGATAVFEQVTKVNGGANNAVANINVLPGTLTFAQSGSSYVLSYNVAAVPEPSGLAMALAGLGVIGFVAARRKNNA